MDTNEAIGLREIKKFLTRGDINRMADKHALKLQKAKRILAGKEEWGYNGFIEDCRMIAVNRLKQVLK